jgi:hypothetical protein
MKHLFVSTLEALQHCSIYAASIFLTYCLACLIGILMSHYGNEFALSQRDKIVGAAIANDKASINYQEGNNFKAALFDCAGNLFFAAVPQTALGFGIVFPYFSVTYQGWIGGIVSVDNSHQTRFKNFTASSYYFIVLLLQFIPFSLSIGVGIKCGVDCYRYNSTVSWKIWNYRIPKTSLKDLGYVYLVCIPLFFIASCFEFLSSWNI